MLRNNPTIPTDDQAGTWQVMVAKRGFTWFYVKHVGGQCAIRSLHYDGIIPPLMMLNTKAPDLLGALFKHPIVLGLVSFAKTLKRVSTHAAEVSEFDGALANDKMLRYHCSHTATILHLCIYPTIY